MVFYENCGLQNLYDIVRYCQVNSYNPEQYFFGIQSESVLLSILNLTEST